MPNLAFVEGLISLLLVFYVCGSGAALRFAPIHDSHGYAVLIFLEMSFHSILKVISKFFFLRFLFHRSGNAVTGNGFIQEYSTQKTTKGKCLYMEEGLYKPLPRYPLPLFKMRKPEALVQQKLVGGCARRRSSIGKTMGGSAQVAPVQQ